MSRAPRLRHSEEIRRPYDADATPGIKNEEIVVAGHDDVGTGRRRKREVFIVLRVTAIGHRQCRFNPNGCLCQQRQDSRPVFIGQVPRELWTGQHFANLALHRRRENNDIPVPRLEQRLPRNAVALESRANDGAGVDDDQSRRSAL